MDISAVVSLFGGKLDEVSDAVCLLGGRSTEQNNTPPNEVLGGKLGEASGVVCLLAGVTSGYFSSSFPVWGKLYEVSGTNRLLEDG